MDNVKKLILVPSELTHTSPSESLLPNLDAELSKILHDKTLDVHSKWRKYNKLLQHYLHFLNETRQPVPVSVVPEPQEDSSERDLKETLLSSVPKSFARQAEGIYQILRHPKNKKYITWDANGVTSIAGRRVENSNVIDLISDLTRKRKNFRPHGVEELKSIIDQLSLPRELVGNSSYHQSGGGLIGTAALPSTPHTTHTRPARPTARAGKAATRPARAQAVRHAGVRRLPRSLPRKRVSRKHAPPSWDKWDF